MKKKIVKREEAHTHRSKINYTGIAALITAIGGVFAAFYQQAQTSSQSDKVQQSMFNYMQTVEQRLTKLETLMDNKSKKVRFIGFECQTDTDCPDGSICQNNGCLSKLAAAKPVEFKAVQQQVKQTNRPVQFKFAE